MQPVLARQARGLAFRHGFDGTQPDAKHRPVSVRVSEPCPAFGALAQAAVSVLGRHAAIGGLPARPGGLALRILSATLGHRGAHGSFNWSWRVNRVLASKSSGRSGFGVLF
jgi:hypothetical protein